MRFQKVQGVNPYVDASVKYGLAKNAVLGAREQEILRVKLAPVHLLVCSLSLLLKPEVDRGHNLIAYKAVHHEFQQGRGFGWNLWLLSGVGPCQLFAVMHDQL